jgi:RHS repeat-associated protein
MKYGFDMGDYALSYDAENRLTSIAKNNPTIATFVFDGDGKRVKSMVNGESTLFVGPHYEVTGTQVTKYYFAGAQRIAMRKDGTPSYMLGDHLGSTSLVTDSNGTLITETKYKAWGEVRYTTPNTTLSTRYTFTGQYSYVSDTATDLGSNGFGLMFYNARWYDSTTGRFAQADTIIAGGVQGLDRYAYVYNSPVNYNDPSGHMCSDPDDKWSPSCDSGNHGGGNPVTTPPSGLSDQDDCDLIGYNGYCHTGKEAWDLYLWYVNNPGQWNDYGNDTNFTVLDFLAWITFLEIGGAMTDAKVRDILSTDIPGKVAAVCEQLNHESCATITNADILNYIATRASAGVRIVALAQGKSPDFIQTHGPAYLGRQTAYELAKTLVAGLNFSGSGSYGDWRDTTYWDGKQYILDAINQAPSNTGCSYGVQYFYEGGTNDLLFFTGGQLNFWDNYTGGPIPSC